YQERKRQSNTSGHPGDDAGHKNMASFVFDDLVPSQDIEDRAGEAEKDQGAESPLQVIRYIVPLPEKLTCGGIGRDCQKDAWHGYPEKHDETTGSGTPQAV